MPVAEIGHGMRREQLTLEPERLERMPGDVEAKYLLLFCQSLGVGQGRDVRQHAGDQRGARRSLALTPAEQGNLSRGALLLLERRFLKCTIEHRPVLRAMTANVVECSRGNQRFEDALVTQTQINPLAEIENRAEWPVVATRGQDRVDGGTADVANRAEPKTNALVADDGELVAGLDDIGREHLEVELASLVDELHDAVRVADGRRQQRRHELGRMVRFEPRRLIRENRVGDGVRLVEAVSAERFDLAGKLLDDVAVVAPRDRFLDELPQLLANQLRVLLADGFAERQPGQVGNLLRKVTPRLN